MNREECKECLRVIHATAEVLGQEIKPAAASLMVQDLREYPMGEVSNALTRCRAEVRGKLTLQAIIERIPSANTFPSPNEAWAIALGATDENETVIWTSEIAEALGAAQPILDIGDKVGARMAFVEKYQKLLDTKKSTGAKPQWTASLGSDPARREDAISNAVRKGLLPPQEQENLLPPPLPERSEMDEKHGGKMIKMLREILDAPNQRKAEERLESMRAETARRNLLLEQAAELEEKRKQA